MPKVISERTFRLGMDRLNPKVALQRNAQFGWKGVNREAGKGGKCAASLLFSGRRKGLAPSSLRCYPLRRRGTFDRSI
jgi:hypothetical protein